MKALYLLSIILFINGCTSIMPYKEESACVYNDLGKCLSIDLAYQEALTGKNYGTDYVNKDDHRITEIETQTFTAREFNQMNNTGVDWSNQKNLYKKSLYQIQKQLINDGSIQPLLQPAVVRRVLIMPYKNSNSDIWHEARHIYYIETEPKWTLDENNQYKKPKTEIDIFQN